MSYVIRQAVAIDAQFSKGRITVQDLAAIRKILGLPSWARFPRCSAKSKTFVAKREAEGDFSHSEKKHICDECRCQTTAGMGTIGNFYGLGEHTGHYGCGWCRVHERHRPRSQGERYAEEHMRLLQGVGSGRDAQSDFALVTREQARVAEARKEVRDQIDSVKEWCQKFLSMCREPSLAERADVVAALKEVEAAVVTSGGLDRKTLDLVMGAIGQAIVLHSGLTESGRGGPQPMSDDTRFKNVRDFAKTISSMAMDDFKVSEGDYVRMDDVAICLHRTMLLIQRFVAKKEDYDKLKDEMKVIWQGVRK